MTNLLIGLIGLVSGSALGAVAAAWGAISVPALIILGIEPVVVIGSSLLAAAPVAFTGGLIHRNFGHVKWRIFIPLLIGGALGASLGALIAIRLPQEVLKFLVGIFTFTMGLIILSKKNKVGTAKQEENGGIKIVLIGLLAGLLAGALGTSWGPVGVTLLILSGIAPHTAVGSSLLARTFATLTGGTIYYRFHAIRGSVLLPLLVGGILGVLLGAFTSRKLSPKVLREVIGVVVVLLGLSVIIKGVI